MDAVEALAVELALDLLDDVEAELADVGGGGIEAEIDGGRLGDAELLIEIVERRPGLGGDQALDGADPLMLEGGVERARMLGELLVDEALDGLQLALGAEG